MQKDYVFIGVSTCFRHHHAHHQENSIKPTTPMVYSTGRAAVDSRRRSGCCALVGIGAHRTTSSPRVYYSTARAVHHRRCRFYTVLLMMGMMMSETCWDTNKYIIFSSSGWLFNHLVILYFAKFLTFTQMQVCFILFQYARCKEQMTSHLLRILASRTFMCVLAICSLT
jgi:hypothetical protein